MLQTLPFEKLHYQFYLEKNLFAVKSGASITFEDLIVHVGNIMAEDDFQVGLNAFYDFSDLVNLGGSQEAFLATAEAMNDHNIINKPAKTAILVADDNAESFYIFQKYVAMTSDSLIDYRVFTISEKAALLTFLNLESMP